MELQTEENCRHGPLVSIVIPCRNERDFIESSVKSILAQRPPDGGFEVIVADGMSDDGTREIVEKLAAEDRRLRVIDNPGRIVSTGLNAGIKAAKGKIIVRMDAHSGYASDYVRQCVAVLEETKADNVGGPWIAKGSGLVSEAIAAAFQSPFAVGNGKSHDPGHEGVVDTVYLGCWRREVFDRIGFFDEELVRNQDDEFNLRLVRSGGRIWQSPGIKSWYRPRDSFGSLFRQYMQYGYWKVRVIQKHRIPASVRHLVPGFCLLLFFTLPALSFWLPAAGWAWVSMVILYGVATLIASLKDAATHGLTLFPVLPFVFACFHLSYGIGFLRGLLDFVILKRAPRETFTGLTRPPSRIRKPAPE